MWLSDHVRDTPDFRRIRELPERVQPGLERLVRLQGALTDRYRRDAPACMVPCEGCLVRAPNLYQAWFLDEAYSSAYGAVGLLYPGAGKTLASFLTPTIHRDPNPVLVVPGAQLAKTRSNYAALGRHWDLAPLQVYTYEYLSHPNQLNFLWALKPTSLIFDECHHLSGSTKAWKRVYRYLQANPQVKSYYLTGTGVSRSIREFWHYVRQALKDGSPLPKDPMEAAEWSAAVDEKVPVEARVAAGALLKLPGEGDDLAAVRKRVQRRILSTKGIVSTAEEKPDAHLEITTTVIELPEPVRAALRAMRQTWHTPGGDPFLYTFDLWRHSRTLGVGMYQVYRPPPPTEWSRARKDWHEFAHGRLKHLRTIDSVTHIVEQIENGALDDQGRWARWKSIQPVYDPARHTVAEWVHDEVLNYARTWAAKTRETGGLVWTAHREFGLRLARESRLPYFSDLGLDASGNLIDDHKGPAICSMACAEGHNLQHHHHENLIVSPMSTGRAWDQLLARTHRPGQKSKVTAEILLTSRESFQCLAQACRDAKMSEETGGQWHRLCYASRINFETIAAMVADESNASWDLYGA